VEVCVYFTLLNPADRQGHLSDLFSKEPADWLECGGARLWSWKEGLRGCRAVGR
jgi:hypothetical protein